MADSTIDQIFAAGTQWIAPRPRFEVGQLWQFNGMHTWRVISASQGGMVGTLQLVAIQGRRTESDTTMHKDQRCWSTATHWACVPEVRLVGGEVLT